MSNNTLHEEDILYQKEPHSMSRNQSMVPYSFTESIQSYMKSARRESWILENNYRVPEHEIVLRYQKVLSLQEIRDNWKRLRLKLKKARVIFAAVIELTDGNDKLPNNCIHYHFLIDSKLTRQELMEMMKTICDKSKLGVYGQDYDLLFPNKGITNWGSGKINYFTKYNHYKKVHLFKLGLWIWKFYYSADWFINQDGTLTKRAVILKRIKDEYKKKKGGQYLVLGDYPELLSYNE